MNASMNASQLTAAQLAAEESKKTKRAMADKKR